ncbi:MAG: phospholipase, partial [Acidobacteria bacterium]
MRKPAKASRDFRGTAISGTHTILLALDCPDARREGLLGFAFQRERVGAGAPRWLRSQKVF